MKNKHVKVKLLRDNRGTDTPVKVHTIYGAASIEILTSVPVPGQKAKYKVLRAGDRITDRESDLVCERYVADVIATL